jgi:uncharacterized RDD family membrane protein YckC
MVVSAGANVSALEAVAVYSTKPSAVRADRRREEQHTMSEEASPAGWYHAQGDPEGTTRYWDGAQWIGEPQFSQPSAFGSTPATGQMDYAPTLERVSGWARVGGRLIDGLIWGVITLIASLPILGQFFSAVTDALEDFENGELVEPEISPVLLVATGVVTTLLIAAYEVVGNAYWGGTLGKQAIGAKVIKADGSPLDLATSIRRMLLYIVLGLLGAVSQATTAGFAGGTLDGILDLVFLVIALIGLVMLFADARRQTPWDKVGGTIVVRKQPY